MSVPVWSGEVQDKWRLAGRLAGWWVGWLVCRLVGGKKYRSVGWCVDRLVRLCEDTLVGSQQVLTAASVPLEQQGGA